MEPEHALFHSCFPWGTRARRMVVTLLISKMFLLWAVNGWTQGLRRHASINTTSALCAAGQGRRMPNAVSGLQVLKHGTQLMLSSAAVLSVSQEASQAHLIEDAHDAHPCV